MRSRVEALEHDRSRESVQDDRSRGAINMMGEDVRQLHDCRGVTGRKGPSLAWIEGRCRPPVSRSDSPHWTSNQLSGSSSNPMGVQQLLEQKLQPLLTETRESIQRLTQEQR